VANFQKRQSPKAELNQYLSRLALRPWRQVETLLHSSTCPLAPTSLLHTTMTMQTLGHSVMSNTSEVYTRLLLPKGHSCPIWCPEPDDNLSLTNRHGGIRIGHVGRIDPDGSFDPLFNICAKADNPINSNRVPDTFEPLVLEPPDVKSRSKYYNHGLHICSEPLEKRPNMVDTDPAVERSM
jgi:hypothetical protein